MARRVDSAEIYITKSSVVSSVSRVSRASSPASGEATPSPAGSFRLFFFLRPRLSGFGRVQQTHFFFFFFSPCSTGLGCGFLARVSRAGSWASAVEEKEGCRSLYRGYLRALVGIATRLVETNAARPLPPARLAKPRRITAKDVLADPVDE